MSAFDAAIKIAKERKLEEERIKKRKEREKEIDESIRKDLLKQINETLDSFDGKLGIKRNGPFLIKKNVKIAEMSIIYGTWTCPNYDTEISGYRLEWKIYDGWGQPSEGSTIKGFIEKIADHL